MRLQGTGLFIAVILSILLFFVAFELLRKNENVHEIMSQLRRQWPGSDKRNDIKFGIAATQADKYMGQMDKVRKETYDYKAAMKILNKEKVAQDDPRLIELIRKFYLEPPSPLPYNLTFPGKTDLSEGGRSTFVDRILNSKERGFFIECGAFDGEIVSNSLYLERKRNWNGLLIEAGPSNYAILKTKHRKAFSINACLNVEQYPSVMTFNKHQSQGRIVNSLEANDWTAKDRSSLLNIQVQCFPLYSLLLAVNRTTIDFFSLDVEGFELYILKTIPFDKVDIKVISAEYALDKGGAEGIKSFLIEKGYEYLQNVGLDVVFKKKQKVAEQK